MISEARRRELGQVRLVLRLSPEMVRRLKETVCQMPGDGTHLTRNLRQFLDEMTQIFGNADYAKSVMDAATQRLGANSSWSLARTVRLILDRFIQDDK